jgi:hypothetical protein
MALKITLLLQCKNRDYRIAPEAQYENEITSFVKER